MAMLGMAAAIAFPAAAQGGGQGEHQTDLSKIERKNKAPISKDVLQVKLPRPMETTLPNGLTVLILEDHRFPTAVAQLNVRGAGALYEPASMPGLAGMTAQLMREGTTTKNSKQIAEEVDRLGAFISSSAPFGQVGAGMTASGLSENMDQWMGLMTDVLLHPSFPADELANVKQRSKANLQQQRSNPSFLANERFSKALYGNFPAATVSTTIEALDAITPEALAKWHHEHYVPQNSILAIAGDVNPAALLSKLKQWLGGWQRTDSSVTLLTSGAPATAKKIYLVDRPNSVQTTLYLGNLALDRKSPDYVTLTVLNRILGGTGAARLFMNLRENKGYTYGAYSNFTALTYAGPWLAYSDVRTEVTDGAMTEFINELTRIRTESVPSMELEEAKRSIVAGFALSLESPQTVIGYAVTRKIYDFPADYWDKYPAQIMAVTSDDILRVAKKYIDPATMQIVAVGDASKIKPVMEKYGTVEMYSTDGKMAPGKSGATPGSN